MAVRELHVVQAAVGLVDAQLGVVFVVRHVRVQFVELGEHRAVGDAAAGHPGVAAQRPLCALPGSCRYRSVNKALERTGISVNTVIFTILADRLITPEEHNLPHVVDEPHQLHPVRMATLADSLGGLNHVDQVRKAKEG